MSTFTDIATETPLEAYLRLRGDGGSFLLESVVHGRLGRHADGSRRMSVRDRPPDRNNPRPLVFPLALNAWVEVPNEPADPEAARWNPPAGILVVTLMIAVFLFPYSASQPPVWKLMLLTTWGSNSSLTLPEIPAGTGTPST